MLSAKKRLTVLLAAAFFALSGAWATGSDAEFEGDVESAYLNGEIFATVKNPSRRTD